MSGPHHSLLTDSLRDAALARLAPGGLPAGRLLGGVTPTSSTAEVDRASAGLVPRPVARGAVGPLPRPVRDLVALGAHTKHHRPDARPEGGDL